jgi:hypothetical protein
MSCCMENHLKRISAAHVTETTIECVMLLPLIRVGRGSHIDQETKQVDSTCKSCDSCPVGARLESRQGHYHAV